MRFARHQVVGVTQAAAGLTLLLRPHAALDGLSAPDARSARRLVRLLGIRLTGQGILVGASGRPPVIHVGAVVDALHAASMFVIAVRSRQWRRAATASALFACGTAVASHYAAPGRTR